MKDAKRLFRHLICSFSSLFTLCTAGSISSWSGTSRLSLMVTGAMQAEGPQGAPTRYPKLGRPHLEATRGLPKPMLHRLREPRQPRARSAPPPPGRHGPLLTAYWVTIRGRTAEQELKFRPPHLEPSWKERHDMVRERQRGAGRESGRPELSSQPSFPPFISWGMEGRAEPNPKSPLTGL